MSNCANRILSIQSHVVHGFVGNKCASFILQTLGYDIDLINSVHLSNHTGYESVSGTELAGSDLIQIVSSLKSNKLFNYSWILTGYMKSAGFINEVGSIIAQLKMENPNMLYLCDPVMGDDGKMYVNLDTRKKYQELMTPLADVITPNFYEFQLLTDTTGNNMNLNEILTQVKAVHLRGPKYIVITSIDHFEVDNLVLLGSTYCPRSKTIDWFQIRIPRLNKKFTGTGDVFSALLLHHMTKSLCLHDACKRAVIKMRKIMLATIVGNEDLSYIRELKIVENRDAFQSINDNDFCDYGLEKLGQLRRLE